VGAEHATAEKVAAPVEAREQEALALDDASPEEARVLMLQRQAGNRAVTALLRGNVSPAVQRAISFDAKKLRGGRSWTKRLRTAFTGADTLGKIDNAFADYGAAATDADKLWYADVIIGLTDHWLEKHGQDTSQNQRRLDLTALGREARQEARLLRRKRAAPGDKDYLDKLESGGFKATNKQTTKSIVVDPAEDVAGGNTSPGVQGADERAVKLAAKYKLTAAEIAAIRLFTQPDYAYINPAAAGSASWLASNVQGAKDQALAQFGPRLARGAFHGAAVGWARGLKPVVAEGGEHATRLLHVLTRMDPYSGGIAYRGERLTEAVFNAKYTNGARIPFGSFGSAAKVRTVAEGYAAGRRGDLNVTTQQNVSYVAEIHVKTARDIAALSAAMTTEAEEEVIILPGTTFTVTQVIPLATPVDKGKPPAKHFYTVVMHEN
jgi:hypothetical protein